MLIPTLSELFERDLNKLKSELALYENEEDIWKVNGQISNPAGNLALHLVGNLNHFIGQVLGNTGYVRDRDSEFSRKYVSREELYYEIDNALQVVKETLGRLPEEALGEPYPLEKWGQPVTTGHLLLHLSTHLNYHLGQVNYHRRLISEYN